MLPKAENSWTIFEAAHLLNRAGFGGSPKDVRDLHALGRERAVDSLIQPTEALDAFPIPTWAGEEQALADVRTAIEKRRTLQSTIREMSAEDAENAKREAGKDMQQENRQRGLEAQSWWFLRMLKTRAPLREKLTLFWHDHFATSIQKVKEPVLLVQQNELFRKQAFGSFKELTQDVLLDPAMVLYLDTESSKKGHPNENFAREVMELFTLGEGNYTEQDVSEAARAFTGYQFNRRNGKVLHNTRQWDPGDKTIFGKTGAYSGKEAIGLIFQKPQAARFMANKLWEFFVYEKPSKAALDLLTESFVKSDLRVGPLLREIFLSQEFYSESAIRSQVKCPIQFMVQILKQLEISDPPTAFPLAAQQQLGQVLFMPPNVAGWDWGQAWINTNTLFTRYNLAGFITTSSNSNSLVPNNDAMKAKGKGPAKRMARSWKGPDYEKIAPRPLREKPTDLVDSLVFRFFQSPVPEKARKSFLEYAIQKKGAVFTDHETAELCHLMLSTPYYQLT